MNILRHSYIGPRGLLLTIVLLLAAQTAGAAHLHDDALPDSACVVCSLAHADKADVPARAVLVAPKDADARPGPVAVPLRRSPALDAARARGPPPA